jgi:HSP20 family protein
MYASMLNHPASLFGQFDRLRRELDDVFGQTGAPNAIRSAAPGSWPAINVGTTATSVEVHAYAPGLDASKIEVTLDRGVLRLSGERQPGIPQEQGKGKLAVYTRERGAGSFSRAVTLPDDVDPNQVSASYRDGVLQVSVARRAEAQARRIAVQ